MTKTLEGTLFLDILIGIAYFIIAIVCNFILFQALLFILSTRLSIAWAESCLLALNVACGVLLY